MRAIGPFLGAGALFGMLAGVGWVLLLAGLAVADDIVREPGTPASTGFWGLVIFVVLGIAIGSPVGVAIGTFTGFVAGLADRCLGALLPRRARWAAALVVAALAVVPAWSLWLSTPIAASELAPAATGSIGLVTAVYLFAFAAFAACRSGVGRWPLHLPRPVLVA